MKSATVNIHTGELKQNSYKGDKNPYEFHVKIRETQVEFSKL